MVESPDNEETSSVSSNGFTEFMMDCTSFNLSTGALLFVGLLLRIGLGLSLLLTFTSFWIEGFVVTKETCFLFERS